MTLIKSISGIRGTIGGVQGDNLTPPDVVKYAAAFGKMLLMNQKRPLVIVGRDARMSGSIVRNLVCATLNSLGVDVIDVGMSTTPTVEMAVEMAGAHGGIILTASHNPKEWNALKLLNNKGEFISAEEGAELLRLAEESIEYATVDDLGVTKVDDSYLHKHIAAIKVLPYVDVERIKEARFTVAVDAINSSGAVAVPELLKGLGVEHIHVIHADLTGDFAHNPEPLPEHLRDLSQEVIQKKCDIGISVDPDVDRLALVCEDGSMFGEEYTLVAVADHVLSTHKGAAVSNLSSSRALRDVAQKHGCMYHASAVGEVNVVKVMKETNAVIGGEGNGGIILPALHYGRDALVGIAMVLTLLAKRSVSLTELKATYPSYTIIKNKIELTAGLDVDGLLKEVQDHFSSEQVNTNDGVKIDFANGWVHLRKSNTEPIIRLYAESFSEEEAQRLAVSVMDVVEQAAGLV